jgi:hypothetical protein
LDEHPGPSGPPPAAMSRRSDGVAGEQTDLDVELAGVETGRGRSRGGWGRRIFDASIGGLIVAILALTLQVIDSAAIQRTWQRLKGVATGEQPPTNTRGEPYALNTAALRGLQFKSTPVGTSISRSRRRPNEST